MTIATILSNKGSDVATVRAGTQVRDAVALLAERRIGALPILDQTGICGIFSERDLVRCVADHGSGVLDWPDLWQACRDAGARWMVVEHDKPKDPARTARASLAFLTGMGV